MHVGGERERTRNPGFDLFFFCVNSGLRGRAGSHGGVLRSLAALTVPAFDIIIRPGKGFTHLRLIFLVTLSRAAGAAAGPAADG